MTTRAKRKMNTATLIQYVEVWKIDDDAVSMRLQSHSRLRGSVVDSESSQRSIVRGEGLAGMAWNQRHPVVLQESPSDLLQRLGTQNGLELSALIAYPIMKGMEVTSVVVMGVGPGPGAVEVWSRDDRDELSISTGYYSGLKSFEFISRHVKFPKGAGLPGKVWKTGWPRLAQDLPNSPAFMRSFGRDECELNTGLGLPVGFTVGNSDSVLLLLSSHDRPFARGFEIWAPAAETLGTGDEPDLRCESLDWTAVNDFPIDVTPTSPDAVLLESWKSGVPVFSTDLRGSLSVRPELIDAYQLRAVLAMPIYRGDQQVAAVMMVF